MSSVKERFVAKKIGSLLKGITFRKLLPWGLTGFIILSIVMWVATRETLPSEIRIATASKNGQYYHFAAIMGRNLEKRTNRPVRLLETKGSVENRELLFSGEADIALLQSGAVKMDGLVAVTPLYKDVVHVVVRKGRGIQSIEDLAGRKVVLGPMGSGMRPTALRILSHYRVNPNIQPLMELYFTQLESDTTLDAALVTTGFLNPDLKHILASGQFKIIPILDAEALSIHYAHLSPITIPRGLYSEQPAIPDKPTLTVATTAFLAVREDIQTLLVKETLAAVYETNLYAKFPSLMSKEEAKGWLDIPLHPSTHGYFNPHERISLMALTMEMLAGLKELLFALGAGIYLLWIQFRRRQSERENRQAAFQIARLDEYLDETIRIESAQMDTDDPQKLWEYLDEVTRIKLRALDELTDRSLRGDRLFSIFLMQCSNLIRKIQFKITLYSSSKSP